jgi:hypothetical protein
MKIGFTGDLSLHNVRKDHNPLISMNDFAEDVNVVVNLEAPFLPSDFKGEPIKNKICLRQDEGAVDCFF